MKLYPPPPPRIPVFYDFREVFSPPAIFKYYIYLLKLEQYVCFCFIVKGTATIKPCFVAPTETLEESLESNTSVMSCSVDPADPHTSQPLEHRTGTDTQGIWYRVCFIAHGSGVNC
jgi:hypothetical protein